MGERLDKIQEFINRIFFNVPKNGEFKYYANDYIHIYGVSSFCTLLAGKRKLDRELAAVSGMLHDVYRLKTGINVLHGENGAEMGRVVLRDMDFSNEEKHVILSAVFHHSDKAHVHDDYDELLKDADVTDSFIRRGGDKAHISHMDRLEKISGELGLSLNFNSIIISRDQEKIETGINRRNLLAEKAEKIASSEITGSREDAAYMNLIRYWPEDSAFDELENAWCAAFVYHCCQEAGFHFPIKWAPCDELRFACVAAWNVWARNEKDYFIPDAPGFVPERGDIVLYKNIIPQENKPAEQKKVQVDHIGIVLKSGEGQVTIAEGNVNNENKSGIKTRPLHRNMEGFIRLGEDLSYNASYYDYKIKGVRNG